MANEYSLVPSAGDTAILDVVVADTAIGQVGVTNGQWRFRLGTSSAWSEATFGSEFEASELLLVEHGLLEITPGGVVVSKIKVHK